MTRERVTRKEINLERGRERKKEKKEIENGGGYKQVINAFLYCE